MRKLILLTGLIVCAYALAAQTKVLEFETPADSLNEEKFGENRSHFVHVFLEGGLITGISDPTGNYNFPKSIQTGAGLQYKLKLAEWIATGAEVQFEHYNYRLKDDRPDTFPDTVLHDKENVQYLLSTGTYFIRFNMDNRGNVVGKYFDMGVGGALKIGSRYVWQDELENGEVKEVKLKKYNGTLPNTWYVYGRLGVNNWSLYGKYRMSRVFKPSAGFPEAPPLTIGLRIGLH